MCSCSTVDPSGSLLPALKLGADAGIVRPSELSVRGAQVRRRVGVTDPAPLPSSTVLGRQRLPSFAAAIA